MKTALVIAAVLAGLALPASAQLGGGGTSTAIVRVDNADVRTGPGANYPRIGEVRRNQSLMVAGCGNGWCQILAPSGYAYVTQAELSFPSGQRASGAFSGTVRVDAADVRSSPASNFPKLGEVRRNQTVTGVGCSNGWCQIYFMNGYGFVTQGELNLQGGQQPTRAFSAPTGAFSAAVRVDAADVHSGPGANYPRIGEVRRNQALAGAGCSDGWCQIFFLNGYGYVTQGELSLQPAQAAAIGPFNGFIRVDGGDVRTGPGANYPSIGELRRNQAVSVAGCNNGWCTIYVQGGYGFMRQSDIGRSSG